MPQGTGPCGEGRGACEGGLGPRLPGADGRGETAGRTVRPRRPRLRQRRLCAGGLARTAWVNPHKGATSPQCEDSCVNSAPQAADGCAPRLQLGKAVAGKVSEPRGRATWRGAPMGAAWGWAGRTEPGGSWGARSQAVRAPGRQTPGRAPDPGRWAASPVGGGEWRSVEGGPGGREGPGRGAVESGMTAGQSRERSHVEGAGVKQTRLR